MERTENKGTKKRVSVSGIKRCVHVKKNLPSWAQEHQHAALMFLSAQSTEIKKSPKVATRHRSDEQNGETLQLESKEYLQGWARAQDAHTEQKPSLQNQMPSSVVASPTLHQCGSGVESDVKKQSSGSNKMAFKEFEGTRNPSFFDEKDVYDTGFGTLFQSGDSPFQKKASLGGQFDDAPDSLLVLANAAVSDHSSKHPCNNLKEKDVFEGKLKNT
ncbi:unnamed protein product [Cylindrotheca closterium]|uniref:Uncharacterized protein n=1 Tax=Cylindrotheca closterium TaxID=2856 RepID=A0AAD2FNQ0_9STRA|nr:unnamed protein product [Cylindrotheca closterium]